MNGTGGRLRAALARSARLEGLLRGPRRSRDPGALIAGGMTVAWLLLVGLVWITGSGSGAPFARLSAALSVLLPPLLIWTALGLSRAIADLRDEATSLRLRLDALRRGTAGGADEGGEGRVLHRNAPDPDDADARPGEPAGRKAVSAAVAPVADSGRDRPRTDTAGRRAERERVENRPVDGGARPAGGMPRPSDAAARPVEEGPPPRDEQQHLLPLDTPASDTVSPEDLVAALNFPDGPDDLAAIRAQRTALADPQTARLIRSAQDVITLMARHDLYMDELDMDPAPAPAWRQLAAGARGRALAPLSTIRDTPALEATAALMRADELFRDAAQHFLRRFERTLVREDARMNDRGIEALALTRSGRAFALLAQASGMFGGRERQ